MPKSRRDKQLSITSLRAFTLIELLVVISIIALLMAILMPTLSRARKQAKATVCRAKLRHWGIALSAYMSEHQGLLTRDWFSTTSRARGDCNDLLLCPVATRTNAQWEKSPGYVGSTFTVWKMTVRKRLYGSYGLNCTLPGAWLLGPPPGTMAWEPDGRCPLRGDVPVLFDCASRMTALRPTSDPPPYDGALDYSVCINRHEQGVNSLFLDWSVRKVGLKELWILKWYPTYDTGGPWTRAGGVQPEDWPARMRKFKDY